MVRKAVQLPIPRGVDKEAAEQSLRRFGYMVQETYEQGQRTAIEQEDLNHRQDLLSPLLDYGSAYMNHTNPRWSGQPLPFTNQVGPMRGCRLEGGRIVLESEGLWDIRCQLFFDFVSTLTGHIWWEIRVLRPDNSLYTFVMAQMDDQRPVTMTNVASVVVPEPDYKVEAVVINLASTRGLQGGVHKNRLTVQHISRDTQTGDTGQ
ncbi:hypothetical protein [Rhodococcoides fascians]|uniref:hypothetical protein n=1 Tax=Rhodococcoides fascians TaxID=1828 RepID=UPI00068FF8C2|nr:hypothetical protein [Rhodococcus fascians]